MTMRYFGLINKLLSEYETILIDLQDIFNNYETLLNYSEIFSITRRHINLS